MGMDSSLVRINEALFRKVQNLGSKSADFIFPQNINCFNITRPAAGSGFWGILGPRKSDFLNIIASNHISVPPLARSYARCITSKAGSIAHLDFRERSGLDKVHLAARYESYSYKGKLEMSDDVNSVRNYITGANNYNKNNSDGEDEDFGNELINLLGLEPLLGKWVNSLSNGQMRRARIARALYRKPSLLLIDDPFLGLDPAATTSVAKSLNNVTSDLGIGLVLGLRMQDEIPSWVSHLAYVNNEGLASSGPKTEVYEFIKNNFHNQPTCVEKKCLEYVKTAQPDVKKPQLEFLNASVSYKESPILSNLSWSIGKGSKWRIIGANGSGKTTLLALITADHPQSWRSVLKVNGILRKPGSGVDYFGNNDKIGLSSPELHASVPNQMSMRDVILNGLIPGIGNSNFMYKFKKDNIPDYAEKVLRQFEGELKSNGTRKFFELSTSLQKLTLFLRAIVKNPDILILDEAFSCMDDEILVSKCHRFIAEKLQSTTVLSIGHIDWEVPQHDCAIRLLGDEGRSYEFLEPIYH